MPGARIISEFSAFKLSKIGLYARAKENATPFFDFSCRSIRLRLSDRLVLNKLADRISHLGEAFLVFGQDISGTLTVE